VPKFNYLIEKAKIIGKYEDQIKLRPYDRNKLCEERDRELAVYEASQLGASQPELHSESYDRYKLQNGDEVECKYKMRQVGTVDLSDCRDGRTYLSQTNVVKIN
jgi:hypothetical protein